MSQETMNVGFAGVVPAERSEAGTTPASAAPPAGPLDSPRPAETPTLPAAPAAVAPAPTTAEPPAPIAASPAPAPAQDASVEDESAQWHDESDTGDEAEPADAAVPINPAPFGVSPARLSGRGPRPRRRLVTPQEAAAANRKMTPEQKLLILDTWTRSGLSANDFSSLVGVNRITLYQWKKRFQELGPAGLMEQPRKGGSTRAPELTRRTVVMLKQAHPEWGCQRISDVLYRGPALPASANTVARILREAGYVLEESATSPHPDKVRSFERARPNQMWQTDLFTFILKRQNRRVYLVAFMDDHSRYIVSYGLHASSSAALVIETFRAAVASVGLPEEVLTDNGPQYITWRGTSRFASELHKHGVKHIVATPRRPQTLGKVERFWGTLWRECLDAAVFLDLADAQRRVGHFIDHYNFQRPHQALEALTPADRFFGAAPQMLGTLKARVLANALELARSGTPRAPFYLSGQVGGKPFSVHAEGERVFMIADDGQRREVDLHPNPATIAGTDATSPAAPSPAPAPPVPEPLAAHGALVGELLDEHEVAPPPGISPLDPRSQTPAPGDPGAPGAAKPEQGGDL